MLNTPAPINNLATQQLSAGGGSAFGGNNLTTQLLLAELGLSGADSAISAGNDAIFVVAYFIIDTMKFLTAIYVFILKIL